MHRAIVSGVTGHLGRELAHQLVNAGVEVHGLTRQAITTSHLVVDGVQLHRVDGQTETLVRTFDHLRPDTVIHLAALARREHRIGDVMHFVNANILFGTQLLEAARQAGCRRFIAAGSYLQHAETGAYRAFNLYAATKQAFEDLLGYYVDAFGFSASVITLCNIYGEADMRPTLITDMAAACAKGVPVRLHGEEAWIDPIHVEDAAAAFLRVASLLQAGRIRNHELAHYSVTCGCDISSLDLLALFEKVGKRRLSVVKDSFARESRRLKPWRGATAPGWEPRVSIEEGIARLLARHRALAPS